MSDVKILLSYHATLDLRVAIVDLDAHEMPPVIVDGGADLTQALSTGDKVGAVLRAAIGYAPSYSVCHMPGNHVSRLAPGELEHLYPAEIRRMTPMDLIRMSKRASDFFRKTSLERQEAIEPDSTPPPVTDEDDFATLLDMPEDGDWDDFGDTGDDSDAESLATVAPGSDDWLDSTYLSDDLDVDEPASARRIEEIKERHIEAHAASGDFGKRTFLTHAEHMVLDKNYAPGEILARVGFRVDAGKESGEVDPIDDYLSRIARGRSIWIEHVRDGLTVKGFWEWIDIEQPT